MIAQSGVVLQARRPEDVHFFACAKPGAAYMLLGGACTRWLDTTEVELLVLAE
jgi:hypothetical protein